MAKLIAAKRRAIWQRLMEEASADHEVLQLTKTEYRAAVDAIDTWIDNNADAFNASLSPEARANLLPRQKARLFFAVAEARFEEA